MRAETISLDIQVQAYVRRVRAKTGAGLIGGPIERSHFKIRSRVGDATEAWPKSLSFDRAPEHVCRSATRGCRVGAKESRTDSKTKSKKVEQEWDRSGRLKGAVCLWRKCSSANVVGFGRSWAAEVTSDKDAAVGRCS
jgi:hypothetical protein